MNFKAIKRQDRFWNTGGHGGGHLCALGHRYSSHMTHRTLKMKLKTRAKEGKGDKLVSKEAARR